MTDVQYSLQAKRRATLGGKEALFETSQRNVRIFSFTEGLSEIAHIYHLQETCVNIYLWCLRMHHESHLHGDVLSIIYI